MTLLDAAHGVLNASMPLPWLLMSGQPDEQQFRAMKDAGLQRVIDIREPMEDRAFDEPVLMQQLQVEYHNVPVVSGALDDTSMDRVLAALRTAKDKPTLLHCNSANRTNGPLIAFLMIDEKLPEQDVVDLAMRSGLRSVETMEWATDYARRNLRS